MTYDEMKVAYVRTIRVLSRMKAGGASKADIALVKAEHGRLMALLAKTKADATAAKARAKQQQLDTARHMDYEEWCRTVLGRTFPPSSERH